ncbi:MAG: hypothetical protein P4N59_03975 [Negativicutes bacterium]|nr:hypothetical protein [Negativicutes bacterium]
MKRTTLFTLVLAAIFVMQFGASVTHAQVGPALLDPRDGMYLTRIINLTGEQLSIAVANDTSNPALTNTAWPQYYSTNIPAGNNLLINQQNIFTPTPIKLDTLVQHNPQKTYAIPAGNAYWEGMINLTPIIPASNENTTYTTYSGHFSQAQRLTITTVNNQSSILNGAYIQFGYNYQSTQKILWNKIFDFAAATVKNAANIAAACEDGDAKAGISAGASEIKSVLSAFQTSPITASLNSATTLSAQPVTSQTSEFTNQVTTNYAQAMAFFTASGGGSCITEMSSQNQVYTLASAQQVVVKLTASNNTVRYFTAPAYYIYIKNVEAANPGDINECTVAIVDGWVYNLAVGMYNATQQPGATAQTLTTLQGFTPLQLMYYAGSTVSPVASATAATPNPSVAIAVPAGAKATKPVTITNVAISYIGG